MRYTFPLVRDRRALLVVLGGLHLLALLSFGPSKMLVDAPRATFITLVTPAPKPAENNARQERPSAPTMSSRIRTPAPEMPPAEAPVMILVPAADSPSAPEPAQSPLADNVRSQVGAIDKDLRTKSFDLRERKPLAYERPKFERDMEAAGKARGDVIEEIVAPGGRRITRINGKCYYAPHTGITALNDPFKGGPPKITQMNCPREK
jgi:hypothetical protein